MPGPGEYRPDQTEGITRVEDLPRAKVAKIRKELAATKPILGRGRPSSAAARKAARKRKRIEQKVGDLFQHRYLFVQHVLTPTQRRTLTVRDTAPLALLKPDWTLPQRMVPRCPRSITSHSSSVLVPCQDQGVARQAGSAHSANACSTIRFVSLSSVSNCSRGPVPTQSPATVSTIPLA